MEALDIASDKDCFMAKTLMQSVVNQLQKERSRLPASGQSEKDPYFFHHAEIALEQSGQILWVTFASECALT